MGSWWGFEVTDVRHSMLSRHPSHVLQLQLSCNARGGDQCSVERSAARYRHRVGLERERSNDRSSRGLDGVWSLFGRWAEFEKWYRKSSMSSRKGPAVHMLMLAGAFAGAPFSRIDARAPINQKNGAASLDDASASESLPQSD